MRGLGSYLAAATAVRSADAGAPLAVVLLARTPGSAGVLVACLSAPHLAGPLLARRLDTAEDTRPVLAAAFTVYAAALGSAGLALHRAPLILPMMLIVLAGLCGPLLTGGLSSRLPTNSGAEHRTEGWDAVTYGVAGSLGPVAVAGLATVDSPLTALLCLSLLALVGAGLTRTLPRTSRPTGATHALTVRETARYVLGHRPLRHVTIATLVAAAATGGIALLAVAMGRELRGSTGAGAALAAAFGIGTLLASLLVTRVPLRGDPERLTRWAALGLGLALTVCAVSPSYPTALAAFSVVGAANAVFFTATLAARNTYAPPAARAQVFVSLSGVKVAAQAAGTAATGVLLGPGPRPLLVGYAAVTGLQSVRLSRPRRLALARSRAPGPPATRAGRHAGRWPARRGRTAGAAPSPRAESR